jgi:hypothetical protein
VVTLGADSAYGRALESGYSGTTHPLVLVTTATEPWTEGQLRPLLEAIDRCDHAIGRRPRESNQRVFSWLRRQLWHALFAIPARDVHSPCRLHRRAALEAIPLQSATDFADIELLAKATFLGHLIDDPAIPPLERFAFPRQSRMGDFQSVFRHPRFVRDSSPAEDPEGEQERPDRPEAQDDERSGDVG